MLQPTTGRRPFGRRVRAHVRGQAVGYVALFVALGGTSYAAVQLPRNSVRARQIAANAVGHSEIRPHAVGTSDLHAGAVTSPVLAPGAVTAASILPHQVGTDKIADGAITNPKLADDAVDARTVADGAIGAGEIVDGGVGTSELADGSVTPAKLDDATAARVRGWQIVSAHTPLTKGTFWGIGARCPAGKQVLGGGGHIDQAVAGADNATLGSYPERFTDGTSGYHFTARWNAYLPASGWSVTAYAVCAAVSP